MNSVYRPRHRLIFSRLDATGARNSSNFARRLENQKNSEKRHDTPAVAAGFFAGKKLVETPSRLLQ